MRLVSSAMLRMSTRLAALSLTSSRLAFASTGSWTLLIFPNQLVFTALGGVLNVLGSAPADVISHLLQDICVIIAELLKVIFGLVDGVLGLVGGLLGVVVGLLGDILPIVLQLNVSVLVQVLAL